MRAPLIIALLCAAGAAAFFWKAPPPAAREELHPVPAAPVTPEQLAAEVEAVRGLRFKTPLTIRRVPVAELAQKVRTAMAAAVPPDAGAVRVRAALALGFIRAGMEFDPADCLAGSALELPAAHFEAATGTLWINDAFHPSTRPDLTARTVFHLARALAQQHHPAAPAAGHDDALLTHTALLTADATTTAQRHTQQFAGRVPSGVSVPETFPYHASPPALRAVLAFPASTDFQSALKEKSPDVSANALLDRLLANPPRTTAELLHPERYPAPPAGVPELHLPAFEQLPVLTENCAGEFGVRTILKTALVSGEAEMAAAGLLADRYVLFSGTGPGQDHMVWRTCWATAQDAGEFLRAIAAVHLSHAGVPPSAEHFPGPHTFLTFRATTPLRTLAARVADDHSVTFAASPDADTAQRLAGW
jgi:hypothetical protein